MEATDIEIIELAEQPAMVVRRKVEVEQLGATLGDILPRVFGYVIEAGQQPAGMPFMRYFDMDGAIVSLAAGLPVPAALEPDGDIEPHLLPGGRALTAVHHGDYTAVGAVWAKVWERARGLGVTQRFGGWDVYANDPAEVAPEEVETRIYLPLDS